MLSKRVLGCAGAASGYRGSRHDANGVHFSFLCFLAVLVATCMLDQSQSALCCFVKALGMLTGIMLFAGTLCSS